MEEKDFQKINKRLVSEIPGMTDRQLSKVEILGELSRQEQDRRYPEQWENRKQKRKRVAK